MWIYFIYWTIIFSVYHNNSVYCIENEIFRLIVDQIVYDLNPCQIFLFIRERLLKNDIFCQHIIRSIPTVSIDLNKINLTKDNRSLSLPIYRHPTSSTLFISFENQDNNRNYVENLKNTLNTYSQLSPISSRPKYLFVCYNKYAFVQNDFENILLYAWSLKFLDFTILIFMPNKLPIIFTYNTFTKFFYVKTFNKHTKLFPYKLINLHRYTLKVPAIELAPYLVTKRDSTGKVIDMEGMSYNYCKYISEIMNFSIEFVSGAEDSVLKANFSFLFSKLYTNEIDILTFPFNVRSIMYNYFDWLLMGKVFLSTNYVLLVPVVASVKVEIPRGVIIFIPLLFVIIFIYGGLARLLHFPMKHWKIFNILQIFLGVTLQRKPPKKQVEKIIYFSLVVLSMKYSIETITKIMDIKLLKGEVPFDTLEEIADSDLPIYTLNFIIEHIFIDNNDKTMEVLKHKTTPITDIYQCVYQVVENKSCMCITPHSAGVYVTKTFINDDGTANAKVARPSLYDDMAAFGFERASPYVTRFDKITQRIVESGIASTWQGSKKYTIRPADFKKRQLSSKNIVWLQLCTILSFGFIVSCVIFVFELIWRYRFQDTVMSVVEYWNIFRCRRKSCK